jgi:hypothetical protein
MPFLESVSLLLLGPSLIGLRSFAVLAEKVINASQNLGSLGRAVVLLVISAWGLPPQAAVEASIYPK